MIQEVWADFAKFKRVIFHPGFNVVTAEKTQDSKEKDSRNGLGKSSLIEIIHFLLGSSAIPNAKGSPIEEWTFFGSFKIEGFDYVVSRSLKTPGAVRIESGDTREFESRGYVISRDNSGRFLDVKVWARILGDFCFQLPPNAEKYSPTFRSLISYFIRRGRDAYSTPFSHFRKQLEWDIQVNNSFLLHLDWRDSQRAQGLRDRKRLAEDLQRASDLGVIRDYFGKRGELEADRTQIEAELNKVRQEITSFTLSEQYTVVEENADQLTSQINSLVNENYSDRLILTDYEETLAIEGRSSYIAIEEIYREAGAIFADEARIEIEQVRSFHNSLISNRRDYLESEITQLRNSMAGRKLIILDLDEKRARYMRALESNRALEHYSQMQSHLDILQSKLASVEARIHAINEVESAKAQLKIDAELSRRISLVHYNDHRRNRDRAVNLFGEASERLYESPGHLIIDVGKIGEYKFNYSIERKGSGGYSSGAVFCYDLTLAQIWAGRGLNTLVHDSVLFDPIDERQLAHALELAAERSLSTGFQYICAINTDRVPRTQFSPSFDFDSAVVLRLTDATEDGGLFGIRF